VIPLVTASETGKAHPESLGLPWDLWGIDCYLGFIIRLTPLEKGAIEGDSPVAEF